MRRHPGSLRIVAPMSNLRSSNDTATRQAIMEFVAAAADEGSAGFVPPEERIAVFDNDGTLWAEKPMPVQLGFALKRLAETADTDASLRDRQAWKTAAEGDHAWLASVVDKHSPATTASSRFSSAGSSASSPAWR
jgi:hypothetical protein